MLKVFCAYNSKYNDFLKKVVDYILDIYGERLDISNLQEIELVREIEDNKESDGRLEGFGTRIALSERKYQKLPHLDISKLKDVDSFKSVISTLYHEMGHASDMVQMPSMYRLVFMSQGNPTTEVVATLLFLEYVANMRSDGLYTGEHDVYCMQFAKGMWNQYKDNPPELAFYYMAKVSVYFLVRTHINDNRDFYFKIMNDKLLSDFIEDLDQALTITYQGLPFDDSKRCFRIIEVLDKYLPKFEEKYG